MAQHAARGLARKAGPLGRLTHRAEDFYSQLDTSGSICNACAETIYPGAASSRLPARHACHYCREPHGTKPYDTTPAAKESEENR